MMPKIMGIDYGEKRIGLSIGDTLLGIAFPYSVIKSDEKAIDEIVRFIEEEEIETVVVGLPRSLSGNEGSQAEVTRGFAKKLEEASEVEIGFYDERLSSKEAEDILIKMNKSRKERREIDSDWVF